MIFQVELVSTLKRNLEQWIHSKVFVEVVDMCMV